MRVLARIKELDDPERPTPYALHALITREVEEAIAEEREACADLALYFCRGAHDGECPACDAAAAIRART